MCWGRIDSSFFVWRIRINQLNSRHKRTFTISTQTDADGCSTSLTTPCVCSKLDRMSRTLTASCHIPASSVHYLFEESSPIYLLCKTSLKNSAVLMERLILLAKNFYTLALWEGDLSTRSFSFSVINQIVPCTAYRYFPDYESSHDFYMYA